MFLLWLVFELCENILCASCFRSCNLGISSEKCYFFYMYQASREQLQVTCTCKKKYLCFCLKNTASLLDLDWLSSVGHSEGDLFIRS